MNIFFDTETTGIEVEDQIIQIGAIITDTKGELYKKGVMMSCVHQKYLSNFKQ